MYGSRKSKHVYTVEADNKSFNDMMINLKTNCRALWAEALGLNDKWKRSLLYPRQCILQYNSKGVAVVRSNFPVKLNQLYAAFLILLIGFCLSFAQFVRELVLSCYNH